jgi:hypothetical protein
METNILLLLTYTEHKPSANYHTDGKENNNTFLISHIQSIKTYNIHQLYIYIVTS